MEMPLRVLIIEDAPDDAELMALRLSEEGFLLDWRCVDNESDYLAALETGPALILADWTLPQFSGIRALELMREAGLDIPFIIVSGSIGEENAISALRQGAYDYVLKDRPGRLGQAVRHALDENRLRVERRRAEASLRESEELYRQLFQAESDAIFLVDNETGRILETNEAASTLYGYSRHEILSKRNSDLSAEPEDTRRITQLTPPDPGKVIFVPLRYHRKSNGTVFPVEITGRFFIRHGRGIHIAAVRDITDRKRAEDALRKSEESARQLARENAIMAEIGRIIGSTLDIEEVYKGFSQEVNKVISFDRILICLIKIEEGTVKNAYIAGEEVHERDIETTHPLEGSGNAEMVRTGSPLVIQTEDITEYQKRFPRLLTVFQAGFRSFLNVPLFSKGKIIGGLLLRSRKPYAYTDEDVRLAERIASHVAGAVANAQLYAECIHAEKERADLEAQLRQAQKMEAVGRLAGGVAHDFNNMLGVVTGYTELAKGRVSPEDPLYEDLDEIAKAARRSTNLVRQLLAFARRQTVDPRVLDLNRIIGESEKMLRRLVGEDIDVRFLPAGDLWAVKMDPSQIDQLMANLAVNARDAIHGVGDIIIETANVVLDEAYCRVHSGFHPGEYVMIRFSDSGVGMDKETLDRIFEPFFTTKEMGQGTGLGLSTVYGIVKQNNAFINVHSEPGQGATFKIYLPRYMGSIEEVRKEKIAPPLTGTETILVVEDDPQILALCRRILETRGYAVLTANQPGEALLLCEKHQGPIHLLVTDVVMPAMNGKDLKERIEKLKPEIKVLYMSGYTANVIAHRGVLSEDVHFIQKPFNVTALVGKVREVLDLR